MDFSLPVSPARSAVVLHACLGILAIVSFVGCQASQQSQAIQAEQMASLFGPQSSFASASSEEAASIAPVVDAELQQVAGPSVELFESDDASGSFLPEGSQSSFSAASEYQNAQPVEVPVYNGGVIRESTVAEPASPYSYPKVNRVPQPFASGNPLRD